MLGLGAPIRRTAGATALLNTVLILLPAFAGALPAAWRGHVNPWLPSVAGQVIIGPATFTARPPAVPWAGFGVSCGYAGAALIAAAITVGRRDA